MSAVSVRPTESTRCRWPLRGSWRLVRVMLAGALCIAGFVPLPMRAESTWSFGDLSQVTSDQPVCELTYGSSDSPAQPLYPRIIVFVYGPYVGGTQIGQAPAPTPAEYEESYAFCAALAGAGYAPTSEPLQNASITGFTSISPVCSFSSPDGAASAPASAGGPLSYLPSIQAAVAFCSAYADAGQRPPQFPAPAFGAPRED